MIELANIFGVGNPVEVAIIGGVVLLLFGGSKIAGFGKSLGEGLKEFKKATHEEPAVTAAPPAPVSVENQVREAEEAHKL